MKLKHLSMHKTENVPDHILAEIQKLSEEIIHSLAPLFANKDPNIIMGSISWVHAVILKKLISEHDLIKGAEMNAVGLVENCKFLLEMETQNG